MNLLELAIETAAQAHSGQLDKCGYPYIEHSLRVMNSVDTIKEKIVAVLHDVVEDTPVGLDVIQRLFGDEIADAVDAISHRKGEPRSEYYARVKANPIALVVKYADIDDNRSPARLANLDETTRNRLNDKYNNALLHLNNKM